MGDQTNLTSIQAFWFWFLQNEQKFANVIRNGNRIPEEFLDVFYKQISQLGDKYYVLVGVNDKNVIELIVSADGQVKNIVYVEELVSQAPILPDWKIMALKPPIDSDSFYISYEDEILVDADNLFFTPVIDPAYPDEISLQVFQPAFKGNDFSKLKNAIYIFLDNYLGELNFITQIDELQVISAPELIDESIPIHKLKDYLNWREKEFIEKYEEKIFIDNHDDYRIYSISENDQLIESCLINHAAMMWEHKVTYPWMLKISMETEKAIGEDNHYDRVIEKIELLLNQLEVSFKHELAYIFLARMLSAYKVEIYYVCKDFRKATKILDKLIENYEDSSLEYQIYKDKYWKMFSSFQSE